MIEVWRGSINTWECDEMGHLNVRHYIGKAWEALAGLAPEIGLPNAFRAHPSATLRPVLEHVRFMRELTPGQPFFIRAGVLEAGPTALDACLEFVDTVSGTLSAVIRTRLVHVERYTGRPFAFSPQTQMAIASCPARPDPDGAPRSLEWPGAVLPNADISYSALEALQVRCIGRGVFRSDEADQSGVVQPGTFFGRISDSVPNLMAPWRKSMAEEQGITNQGAAVLEAQLVYRNWPNQGDRWQLYTGLGHAAAKTHSLVHWMMDPDSGKPWMTLHALAVTFDLGARRVIPASPEAVAALRSLAPAGLQV